MGTIQKPYLYIKFHFFIGPKFNDHDHIVDMLIFKHNTIIPLRYVKKE